jgi:NADPH-dependent 7-cyano-7-deazaguanine reductase QueF
MKAIKNMLEDKAIIRIEKIEPFYNICPVTKLKEEMNIEVVYSPDEYVLELGSYREFFRKNFDCYVEDIAQQTFNEIQEKITPLQLSVKVYMEEETLTPWSVEINSL